MKTPLKIKTEYIGHIFPLSNASVHTAKSKVAGHPRSNGDKFIAQEEAQRLIGTAGLRYNPKEAIAVEYMAEALQAENVTVERASILRDPEILFTTHLRGRDVAKAGAVGRRVADLASKLDPTGPFMSKYGRHIGKQEPGVLDRDMLVALKLAYTRGEHDVTDEIFLSRKDYTEINRILSSCFPMKIERQRASKLHELSSGHRYTLGALQEDWFDEWAFSYNTSSFTKSLLSDREVDLTHTSWFRTDSVRCSFDPSDSKRDPRSYAPPSEKVVAYGLRDHTNNQVTLVGRMRFNARESVQLRMLTHGSNAIEPIRFSERNKGGRNLVVFVGRDEDGSRPKAPEALATISFTLPEDIRRVKVPKTLKVRAA